MTIELTDEQSELLSLDAKAATKVLDPRSSRAYRLVPEEVFERIEGLLYDDSPWTSAEAAALAGAAFHRLDDTDYGIYLTDPK